MPDSVQRARVPDTSVPFLLEKLGHDAGPMQFEREFIKNMIEAHEEFQRCNVGIAYNPVIELFVDPYASAVYKVPKLAFGENAIGMDEERMRLWAEPFVTTKRQGIDANYGVGSKAATALYNPVGVMVRSWRDGVGHFSVFGRDHNGFYGLRMLDVGEGRELTVVPLTQEFFEPKMLALMKPKWIAEHGTVFTLLGASANEDTTLAPDSSYVTNTSYWAAHIANKQFATIPLGITATARIEPMSKGDDSKRHARRIRGYRPILDENAWFKETVDLPDAKVHVYILRDDEQSIQKRFYARPEYHVFTSPTGNGHGHVAVQFENELHAWHTGRAATALLQKFGVYAGTDNVVLYLEPNEKSGVTWNLTRTSLTLPNDQDLPWGRWANEFVDGRMPATLRDYVNARLPDNDADLFITNKLKEFGGLLEIRRPVKDSKGAVRIEASADVMSPTHSTRGAGGSSHTHVVSHNERKTENALGIRRVIVDEGDKARMRRIRTTEPLRLYQSEVESKLIDRAARFDPDRNVLFINTDYAVYVDLVQYGLAFFTEEHRLAMKSAVETVVRRFYGLSLSFTVMAARASCMDKSTWNDYQFKTLISEEALTGSVLYRVSIMNDIRRALRGNPAWKRLLAETEAA